MKRLIGNSFIIAVLLLIALPAFAWDTEVLEENGPAANRINIAILGDGYTAEQQSNFRTHADWLVSYVYNQAPFAEYRSHFNFYLVYVISNESGADHPSQNDYRDTALDATYEVNGIDRLLAVDYGKAFSAASEIDSVDYVFVIVNDTEYGGSGGSVAVSSIHTYGPEILTHEIGHMFGDLADEYESAYPGYPPGDYEPNVTYQTQRDLIPWNVWIEASTPVPTPETNDYAAAVGLFEGARYLTADIYRPKLTCRMRELNRPFCEVCGEALIVADYRRVSPSDAAGGAVRIASDGEITLEALPVQPISDSISVQWKLDGAPAGTDDTLLVSGEGLWLGAHYVEAVLQDESSSLRTDSARNAAKETISWNLTVGDAPDGDLDSTEGEQPADGDAIDGDQITDGDVVVDGDQITDGDAITDGDQVTDGDTITDGDQITDGDNQADGDDTDGDTIDGDDISDGDEIDGDNTTPADQDNATDGDLELEQETTIIDDGSGGSCRMTSPGDLSALFVGLLLFALSWKRRRNSLN